MGRPSVTARETVPAMLMLVLLLLLHRLSLWLQRGLEGVVGELQTGWARGAADDPARARNHDIMAHVCNVLAHHRMIWSWHTPHHRGTRGDPRMRRHPTPRGGGHIYTTNVSSPKRVVRPGAAVIHALAGALAPLVCLCTTPRSCSGTCLVSWSRLNSVHA